MSGEGYRTLLRCRTWSERLRAKGFTWDQIADVLALTHQDSPLRLYRFAHGRTAIDVVNEFNDLDPAGTASLREGRLFDFENWPARGRRPTRRVLVVLARIYQTAARNLVTETVLGTYTPYDRDVIEQTDFRHLDPFQPVAPCPDRPADDSMTSKARKRPGRENTALSTAACSELLRAVTIEEDDMQRRELVFELSLALGGLPALHLLRHLTPAEEDRLARAVRGQGRIDAATVATIEKLTARCRRLDDTYGPAKVLPVVEANREMVSRLLATQSLLPGLRTRLVHAYAELAQSAGFLAFDQMDYAKAAQSLDRALGASLECGDAALTSYIHHWHSEMASFAGQPAKGLDHALAAQGWANRSNSNLIRARSEYAESYALSLLGDTENSLRRLEAANHWAGKPATAEPAYLYWIAESGGVAGAAFHIYTNLGRTKDVFDTTAARLANCGSLYSRSAAFALIHQGMALTQLKEIPEATTKLAAAVPLMRTHSSARLRHLFGEARKRLAPWSNNAYVRSLDEQLKLPTTQADMS
ncbi:hypothetical protein AB0K60_14995 [Thermopolyspora sp. NPDC052614]|uniref:hypothetical protein n=1 Tax=Thermopolyspora sp. NPDC052614 TaxID=3155682 RepID=UPI003444BD40